MSLIKIDNLTFAYEGSYYNIFENISLQLDTNWKLGFIGRNGRGKTTFLKLLVGEYEYRGTISATTKFTYFPFKVLNDYETTLVIFLNLEPTLERWVIERELNLLEVDLSILERPFNTLSKGEQTKVLLALMFVKDNAFLLIDEPTNHLDLLGRQTVARYLNQKKGYILVSHDRHFLDDCIDHVLSINRNNIEVVQGNFSSWYENKKRQDNYELEENAKLEKEIDRLEQTWKEKSTWSDRIEKTKLARYNDGIKQYDKGFIGHKAAKMMKRAKLLEKRQHQAIEETKKLLRNIETSESLKISSIDYHAKTLAFLDDVTINYGSNIVCSHVSFSIEKGDRIALVGANGSGKSSIIKLICGDDIPHTGLVKVASNLVISYVSQDTSFLKGGVKAFIIDNQIDESLFKTILIKLDFSQDHFGQDIQTFSEGQKKKILIAKSLCQSAHLYIFDEPLNYIDVLSRIQIESLILQSKPTLLFVEHDQMFSESIATKRVIL